MDQGTQRFSAEIVVNADPVTAHKLFVSRVWWGGGFPWYLPLPASGVIEPQQDESGKGSIRQVPGFIQEQILDAQLGEYLEYTLKRKLFMPISYHRGRVSFSQVEEGKTLVKWDVSYTPLPVVGALFPLFTSTFSLFFLPALQQACEEHKKKKDEEEEDKQKIN
ncbi:hypothetical protein BASA81_000736 [Batrachochytrium salamandrivorans]|nr:hypothetical protein BASA81_000736 [Batrachochytrium salamandrivorans]